MNRAHIVMVPIVASLLGCQSAAPKPEAPAPVFYPSPQEGTSSLPFSEAVQAGDLLFLSGQIGNVPGTLGLAPGGIDAETRQTLDNIKAILQRHGASFDDVVKCTVFLADIAEWQAFNAIYRTYFPKHFPARSALAASGLALGARVEVECIAYVPAAGD